jgi:hypothetical protein
VATTALIAVAVVSCRRTPTEPILVPLTGVWTAHAYPLCSPIDLSTARLEILQAGSEVSGVLKGVDGHASEVSGAVQGDTGFLIVTLPPTEHPCAISLRIDGVTRTAAGVPTTMRVVMIGFCCEGTVDSSLRFTRDSGA